MAAATLSQADLHALVDGQLAANRRADVLRRAAASPLDRRLVEDWQDQGDWLRGAFASVEREPLPASLDLGGTRHLRSVPFDAPGAEAVEPAPGATRRWRGTLATLTAMAVGLAGSWYVAASSGTSGGGREAEGAEEALPISTIPDLSRDGYAFVAAERPAGAPGTLVFHYRGAGGGRVELDVGGTAASDAGEDPRTVSWTEDGRRFRLSGLQPELLQRLAATLRRDRAER